MRKEISILFSGGPDSTLAVLHALEKADRVHLLTFHHRYMSHTEKHRKVVTELRGIFGGQRIVEHLEHIDLLFKRFYFTEISEHIVKYRTFYIPWICGACKMAMHTRTIIYNRAHDIPMTYDGANLESAPYFPAQTENYIEVMRSLYQSYGMQYECPVYRIWATDVETEKYGMSSTKRTKRERVIFSTQHTCLIGYLIHAHSRLYYRPFRGKNRMRRLAGEFLGQMIKDCKPFLP